MEEQSNAHLDLQRLYATRENKTLIYDKQEVSEVDMEIHVFSARFYSCQNITRRLPTHYNANLNHMSWFCHDNDGMGTKNIVIIGNSHGRELWNGMKYHFKNVYKTMTLFVRDYCMPFMSRYASADMRLICEENEHQVLQILKQWNAPIDIIVAGIEYFNDLNPEIVEPLKQDEYLTSMQTFYNALGDISREVVFLPRMHMDWTVEPYAQVLQKHIHFEQTLQAFQQTIQVNFVYLSLKGHICLFRSTMNIWLMCRRELE
jgi:hypothetical protein